MNPITLPIPEVVEVDMSGVDMCGDGLIIRLQEFSRRNEDIMGNNSENIIYTFFPYSLAKLFRFQRMFGPDGFPSVKRDKQYIEYIDLLISLLPILCEADKRNIKAYLKHENLSKYNYDLLIRYHITPDNILSKILTSPHPGSIEQIPYREICTYELFRLHAEEFQQRLLDKNYIFHSENPDAYQSDERSFIIARLSMSLEVMKAYLESPFIQEYMIQFQGDNTDVLTLGDDYIALKTYYDVSFRSTEDGAQAAFLESHFKTFYEMYEAIFKKIQNLNMIPRSISLRKFLSSKSSF